MGGMNFRRHKSCPLASTSRFGDTAPAKMKTVQTKSGRSPAKHNSTDLRAYSSIVVDGPERAASRAMLYAVGFKKEDFKKPQIGVVSTWSQVTPCNIHIDQLAVNVVKGKVRSKEACPLHIDAAAPRSEVENRIVQIERDLEIWDGLAMELGTECCFLAVNTR